MVELLLVIAIIGIIASVGLASMRVARQRALIVSAKADQSQLRTVILQLESDTSQLPNHLVAASCTQNVASVLLDNSGTVGVAATDGNFPKWGGPYMTNIPSDPWFTPYYFDKWRVCNGHEGCTGITNGTTIRAIVSFGPNKVEEEAVGSDDIVMVLCK